MIELTTNSLSLAVGCPSTKAAEWLVPFNRACLAFGITTKERMAAFLAQVGHESMGLHFTREIWNPAQCPWQAKYEGRKDLGNVQKGDGATFLGRGFVQITGRANYRAVSDALGVDFVSHPQMLEQSPHAIDSAAWFWSSHGLNEVADQNTLDSFKWITRRINGGYNGLEDRMKRWETAKKVIV